jgi:Ca2+-transporting ATPase
VLINPPPLTPRQRYSLGESLKFCLYWNRGTARPAKVIVTNTGMTTELGKIAQMLATVGNEPTPLQKRMTHLGNVLVAGSLILVALTITVGLIRCRLVGPRGIRSKFPLVWQ